MAKIRHISYRAEDVDAMAKFFIDAMGMTMVQKRKDGAIDLSDGSVNISILPLAANRSRRAGLDHIGFSAEDDQDQIRRVEAGGAIKESTRSLYEEKFKGPEGIIVDVGRWPGAAPLEKE
jgi:catechol 2,3-dioxygenase-like lactoylglutathione lyase family enzyme